METRFEFNTLTEDNIKAFSKKAFVFNISEEELCKVQLIKNEFHDDELGGSAECVDIFVDTVDKATKLSTLIDISQYLDKSNYFVRESDSGSGVYALGGMIELLNSKDIEFKGILTVIRIMSNFAFDDKGNGSGCTYYSICPMGVCQFLQNNTDIDGWLAKNKVKLTENYKDEIIEVLEEALKDGRLLKFNHDNFKERVLEP